MCLEQSQLTVMCACVVVKQLSRHAAAHFWIALVCGHLFSNRWRSRSRTMFCLDCKPKLVSVVATCQSVMELPALPRSLSGTHPQCVHSALPCSHTTQRHIYHRPEESGTARRSQCPTLPIASLLKVQSTLSQGGFGFRCSPTNVEPR
jgi:hypothetical protein